MANPNLALLEIAAARLKPLIKEIVFVGGCATGLLITDPAAAAVRKTYDVDVIAEIGSYAEYALFSDRLRHLRFTEDTSEGAPVCRWVSGELKLDVMPLDEKILGFSNRWYKGALEESHDVELTSGIMIRAITPPYLQGLPTQGRCRLTSRHSHRGSETFRRAGVLKFHKAHGRFRSDTEIIMTR
jgi:hypothetical protein